MNHKKCLILTITGVLLFFTFITSILVGKNVLTINDLLAIFSNNSSTAKILTFWNFRLPRSLLALVGGFGLAVAGFLLQGVTKNDLADSSVLGINSGAGLFVMLYLGFYAQGSSWLLILSAIGGGLFAAILVILFAFKKRQRLSMASILLAGIAVNAGLSAVTLLTTIKISKERYQFVTSWMAGSLWGTNWHSITILIPLVTVLSIVAWWRVPILNYLSLGEDQAVSLGLNVSFERLFLLIIAIALSTSCVAFTGSLSFLGLLAPHIAKRLLLKQSKSSLILSGLLGSILVLVADIGGRLILPTGEIPAGIIISVIGAPYFLYLLLKQPN